MSLVRFLLRTFRDSVHLYSAFYQVIRLWYDGGWKYKPMPSSYDVSIQVINPVNYNITVG